MATGVPSWRYTQAEILDEFLFLQGADQRRARAVRVIFERAGVAERYGAVERSYFREERTTQARNDAYMEVAIPLGEAIVARALESAGLAPDEIDDLFVVSCTGFNIPGLDLHIAGRLKMRHDLQRTCVLGMGCYGAFPGLLRARHAVNSAPGRKAVVLAVELCSLHLQTEQTVENIVSAALFSDGAAAVVLGDAHGREAQPRGPRILHSVTHSDYMTLDHMAFTVTDHGFQMYLSSYVPDVLAANVEAFVDKLLAPCGLRRQDVRFWGVHPGSKKIVEYVQERLDFPREQMDFSLGVLRDYGNMSSATILFVLERMMQCGSPQPGDYGVFMAFGPGLTMESMLVQW
jgi:alkylresorcinol/alkylpyrone synthase